MKMSFENGIRFLNVLKWLSYISGTLNLLPLIIEWTAESLKIGLAMILIGMLFGNIIKLLKEIKLLNEVINIFRNR